MPAEITQENVRLLIPGKAARVATLIAAHRHITLKAALLVVGVICAGLVLFILFCQYVWFR